MAEQTSTSQQVKHRAHEQGVKDGRWQFEVTKVARALIRVESACSTDVVWTHRPVCWVVKSSGIGMIGGVQQDRVDDLLDRDPTDVLCGEKRKGRRSDCGRDGLLDIHH